VATPTAVCKLGLLFLAAQLFADNVDRLVSEGGTDGDEAHQAPAFVRILDQFSDNKGRKSACGINDMARNAERSARPVEGLTRDGWLIGRCRRVIPRRSLRPGASVMGHKRASWVARIVGVGSEIDKVKPGTGRAVTKLSLLQERLNLYSCDQVDISAHNSATLKICSVMEAWPFLFFKICRQGSQGSRAAGDPQGRRRGTADPVFNGDSSF
jgi:hypothetical protein